MKEPSTVSEIVAWTIVFSASCLTLLAYWSWFGVPIFHVSDISVWGIVGLRLFFEMLLSSFDAEIEERYARYVQTVAEEAYVPPPKPDESKTQLERFTFPLWPRVALSVGVYFAMLVVGFVIRLFM